MRNFIRGIVVTLLAQAVLVAIVWFLVLPRLDWGADHKPGAVEQTLANNVLARWIKYESNSVSNPLPATQENLKAARADFDEHCAACHGLDGGGANRFEGNFYPPVAKLTGSAQKMTDAEIYFVIANGIALSAMPAFGERHSPDEIWKIVLWVRHLSNLTPSERKEIERETSDREHHHEEMMRQMRD